MKKREFYIYPKKDSLNLEKDFTFGMEVEFDDFKKFDDIKKINNLKKRNYIQTFLNKNSLNSNWYFKEDPTVEDGGEIVNYNEDDLDQAITDSKRLWDDFDKILNFLKDNAKVSLKCAGHIHIGAHVFEDNPEYMLNFLLLFATYEDVLIKHCQNDYPEKRDYMKDVVYLKDSFLNIYDTCFDQNKSIHRMLEKVIESSRRSETLYFSHSNNSDLGDINFKYKSVDNTIEFRFPNSTFETSLWQNNIYLLYKFINYCKSKDFNKNAVLYDRYNTHENSKKAINLANLIFDDDFDKVNFFHQYFKNTKLKDENEIYNFYQDFIYKDKNIKTRKLK